MCFHSKGNESGLYPLPICCWHFSISQGNTRLQCVFWCVIIIPFILRVKSLLFDNAVLLPLWNHFFIQACFLFLCIKLLVNLLSDQAFGASSRRWVAVPGKSLSRIPHYHQQPSTGCKCQVCCLITLITLIKPGL